MEQLHHTDLSDFATDDLMETGAPLSFREVPPPSVPHTSERQAPVLEKKSSVRRIWEKLRTRSESDEPLSFFEFWPGWIFYTPIVA